MKEYIFFVRASRYVEVSDLYFGPHWTTLHGMEVFSSEKEAVDAAKRWCEKSILHLAGSEHPVTISYRVLQLVPTSDDSFTYEP